MEEEHQQQQSTIPLSEIDSMNHTSSIRNRVPSLEQKKKNLEKHPLSR